MLFFQKKIDRVINVKEIEERHKNETDREPLEKGDVPAMLIAALVVFVPAVLLLIGVCYGVMWLFVK